MEFEHTLIFLSGFFSGIIVEYFVNRLKNLEHDGNNIVSSDFLITLDLSKQDLIRLITSYVPLDASDITQFEADGLGVYCGDFVKRWKWDVPALFHLADDSLISLYFRLKKE